MPKVKSPVRCSATNGEGHHSFASDQTRVRYRIEFDVDKAPEGQLFFEKAGPREWIFFEPSETRAAIITCGGLCPGLNNVIRSIFLELHHNYKVRDVLGLRYGYQGLNPKRGHSPRRLTPACIENIHKDGGTVLGSSRGYEEESVMADFLQQERINLLFCIGGDGTQRGAHRLFLETQRRGLNIAIVGIPKTIDNDLRYCWRSFGFFTAIERAKEALQCAHNEAKGVLNGIGLVKVMGRDAGFIAAGATLASQEVNFTLIPEVPFQLEGERGFLNVLKERIVGSGHAVIVVAEGAGQHLFDQASIQRDSSGNVRHQDIGLFLKRKITTYFAEQKIPVDLKYIDPSYLIRSVPANCDDSLLCDQLGRRAVHAAMAGKTDVLVGYWHHTFIHVPIPMAIEKKKHISPESDLWASVLAATGQPRAFQ